jgi:hypothetical protein
LKSLDIINETTLNIISFDEKKRKEERKEGGRKRKGFNESCDDGFVFSNIIGDEHFFFFTL